MLEFTWSTTVQSIQLLLADILWSFTIVWRTWGTVPSTAFATSPGGKAEGAAEVRCRGENIYNPNKNISVNELRHYIAQLGSTFILTGDFNAHNNLLDDNINNPNQSGCSLEEIILNDNICLINPRNFYTHYTLNTQNPGKSCLDLVLLM